MCAKDLAKQCECDKLMEMIQLKCLVCKRAPNNIVEEKRVRNIANGGVFGNSNSSVVVTLYVLITYLWIWFPVLCSQCWLITHVMIFVCVLLWFKCFAIFICMWHAVANSVVIFFLCAQNNFIYLLVGWY